MKYNTIRYSYARIQFPPLLFQYNITLRLYLDYFDQKTHSKIASSQESIKTEIYKDIHRLAKSVLRSQGMIAKTEQKCSHLPTFHSLSYDVSLRSLSVYGRISQRKKTLKLQSSLILSMNGIQFSAVRRPGLKITSPLIITVSCQLFSSWFCPT